MCEGKWGMSEWFVKNVAVGQEAVLSPCIFMFIYLFLMEHYLRWEQGGAVAVYRWTILE